jgi:hypothetical protein
VTDQGSTGGGEPGHGKRVTRVELHFDPAAFLIGDR